ncbi:sugar kinase [Microbacterium sp. NPDC003461]
MPADRRPVLCIGETMAVIAPVASEPVVDADLFRMEPGGAESNVAARLAALGHDAVWLGRLGRDPIGERIARSLRAVGVTTRIEWDDAHPTGLYVKDPGGGVHYYRAGSAASHADARLLAGVDWGEVALLHVTGITAALSPGCRALLSAAFDAARDAGIPVSFDVNHRAPLWDAAHAAPVLRDLARRADIAFVGLDEAEGLWGTRDADDVRALLDTPATLVVKDGAVGATAYARGARIFEAAPRVDVVEPVGAGDAFAAGFLSGVLDDAPVGESLRRGHECAAIALSSTRDM